MLATSVEKSKCDAVLALFVQLNVVVQCAVDLTTMSELEYLRYLFVAAIDNSSSTALIPTLQRTHGEVSAPTSHVCLARSRASHVRLLPSR